MQAGKNCIDLIKKFEGLKLESYKCPAGLWTIGYGNTQWENGIKVKENQVIDIQRAEKLLTWELNNKKIGLSGLKLSQNQFDALLSFIYNVGLGNWNKSTLLKKCKVNSDDSTIHNEFLRWVNKGSSFEKGLTRRRMDESALYFKI